MSTSTIVLIIVIAYLGVLLFIGWYTTRKIGSNEDFLVAGRRLGPVMLAGTLTATEIGGGSTMGVVEKSYGAWGMSALWYVVAMGVTCLIMAIFARNMRDTMVKTVPEYFRRRYDRPSGLFTSIVMLLPLIGLTAAQFIASGVVFSVVMGWDYNVAVAVISVVVIIYSTMGGMWSVSLTDFIQMILIIFGMALAIPYSLDLVGGWDAVVAHTAPAKLSMTEGIGIPTIISLIVMYTASFIVGQEAMQRLYSAKDGKAALSGALLAAGVFALFSVIPASLGLICHYAVELNLIDGSLIASQGAKYALPTLALQTMPGWVVGLLFAGLISATMSSASSDLLGAGSIIANDIYRVYINPNASDAQILRLARTMMVCVGILGLVIAIFNTKALIDLLMFTFSFRAGGAFFPYLLGHYWKGASSRGAWGGLVLGSLGVLAVEYKWFSFFGLDPIFAGLAVSLIAYILLSKMFPPKKASTELAAE